MFRTEGFDSKNRAAVRGCQLLQLDVVQIHLDDGRGFVEVHQAGPRHPPGLAPALNVNDVQVVVGDGQTFVQTVDRRRIGGGLKKGEERRMTICCN